jgi:thiol-disulfide isomerase/thioredoxin
LGTNVIDAAGVWALVATLVLATEVGLVLRSRNGRLRTAGPATGGWALVRASCSGSARVHLLQLSSPVCSPCRQTAALLTELAARRLGVGHREIDVAERPDIARELSVTRTPTVVAFGPDGPELLRVSGVPRLPELEAAIAPGRAEAPPV